MKTGLSVRFAALAALAAAVGDKVKRAPIAAKAATLGVGATLATALPSFAQTPATPDYSAMVTATKVNFLDVVAQGGPGVFLLMGVTAGISWIFLKVRSVAH